MSTYTCNGYFLQLAHFPYDLNHATICARWLANPDRGRRVFRAHMISYSLSKWRFSLCSINGHIGPLQLCWLLNLYWLSCYEYVTRLFLAHLPQHLNALEAHCGHQSVVWRIIVVVSRWKMWRMPTWYKPTYWLKSPDRSISIHKKKCRKVWVCINDVWILFNTWRFDSEHNYWRGPMWMFRQWDDFHFDIFLDGLLFQKVVPCV